MKNYVVKQKLFNIWRSSFYIKNEQDIDSFFVKSDAHLLARLTIYDMDNQPLVKIKKRYFRILPRYDVCTPNGDLIFAVKSRFTIFTKKLKVVSKNPELDGMKIKGNILAWEFDVNKDENIVARISKKILRIADSYCVAIADEANTILYLALAIIVDCVHHKKR